jgi:glucosamine-6-phosphate deaminase
MGDSRSPRGPVIAVFADQVLLAEAAANQFAALVADELERHDEIAVILATGNSQLAFMAALRRRTDINWQRIIVLHMDEYLGMAADHSASFRLYLIDQLVSAVHPRAFHGIQGDAADLAQELQHYSRLLHSLPPAITVMGIGENGHLAFNDPPADFQTTELIRVVTLDEACRRQQWNEGHFNTLEDVPRQALSLTIPALLAADHLLVIVPETRKASAVKAALESPVTPQCPASILQTAHHATLYLDNASAALLTAAR